MGMRTISTVLRELLKDQDLGIRIRNLVLPPEEYLDEKLLETARTAAENGTRVVTMSAGERLESGRDGFSITCPRTGEGRRSGTGQCGVSCPGSALS